MRIFPNIPPLLQKGETLIHWMEKRDRLRSTIEQIEYGSRPDLEYSVKGEVILEDNYPDENAIRRIVNITVQTQLGSHTFPLYVFLPKITMPVPATLLICSQSRTLSPSVLPEGLDLGMLTGMFQRMGVIMDFPPNIGGDPLNLGGPRRALDMAQDMDIGHWPVPEILARGHAVAGFYATDAQGDNGDFQDLARIFGTQVERQASEWGVLAVWAFAAQCALDVLQTMPELNAKQIGITGHSRCGKAALWAAVKDERFAWVMSNNSGCCGSALLRGKHGENITSINAMMPHWFAPAFHNFVGREQELPFDQHMVLALVAPRILYITSGSEDLWADPESEHWSAVLANEIYRLYGNPAMDEAFPSVNAPVNAGAEGYHLRKGPHMLTEYDWLMFLNHIQKNVNR